MGPNAHSTPSDPQPRKLNTRKLPTTNVMMDEAVLELNKAQGFSLQKLKKHISEKYPIDITARRYALIKSRLHTLMADGDLKNVTGRGLSGLIKLEAKNKLKSAGHTKSDVNKATKMGVGKKAASKAKKSKAKSDTLRTGTPVTPPHNQRAVPQAPQRGSVADLNDAEGTPCSSCGRQNVRRRQILQPTCSQEF